MKSKILKKMIVWIQSRREYISGALTGLLIIACVTAYGKEASASEDKDMYGVGVIGVQHIGENFNISEFYVDGSWGGNVGRGGGGGGHVCCVMLPLKWRPGLVAEIRWSVTDWSHEKKNETKAGIYRSVTWKKYKAAVAIEEYKSPEDIYVHFFSGGKVRVVSSIFAPEGTQHPILRNDPKAAIYAAVGHVIDSMFTESELAEMKKPHIDK